MELKRRGKRNKKEKKFFKKRLDKNQKVWYNKTRKNEKGEMWKWQNLEGLYRMS